MGHREGLRRLHRQFDLPEPRGPVPVPSLLLDEPVLHWKKPHPLSDYGRSRDSTMSRAFVLSSYTAAMRSRPAKEVAKPRVGAGFWIDHAEICEQDIEWLAEAERLTLWNVKVPDGFLSKLPRLWWLDLRGGTLDDLSICEGAGALEYLRVSHVRGLRDIAIVADLERLRYLDLYALSKLTFFPSCKTLKLLERAVLGQLKGLKELGGLLEAPNLRELALSKRVGVSVSDTMAIRAHPAIERFSWDPADVPVSVRQPVVDAIRLPELHCGWPLDWFAERGRGPGKGHGHG